MSGTTEATHSRQEVFKRAFEEAAKQLGKDACKLSMFYENWRNYNAQKYDKC